VKLVITDHAIAHLVESVELTGKDMSLERREALVEKVLRETDRLLEFPKGGQVEQLMDSRPFEYRRLVVGNFKIIYRIDGEVIYVTDIFDARQDPRRMRG
jgi:plasmid stabilization system protein ParE